MPDSRVKATVQSYVQEVELRFPGAKSEIILNPGDGHDAWVRIRISGLMPDALTEVLKETIRMEQKIWDETGVSIVGMVTTKEPVTNG